MPATPDVKKAFKKEYEKIEAAEREKNQVKVEEESVSSKDNSKKLNKKKAASKYFNK